MASFFPDDVETVDGVTPGTVGLEVLAADTATEGRDAIDAQAEDADLTAIADLSTAGLVTRTGAGTAATRSVASADGQITVANGDGVSGNPTLTLAYASALRESGGTTLTMGAVADTEILTRDGTTIVGSTVPALIYGAQTISGDTTLTTQRVLLNVTASAVITLPAISGWTTGKVTKIVYRGTTAAQIVIVPDTAGPDLIEGSERLEFYGTDIEVWFTPVAANKIVIGGSRGMATWTHTRIDLTTATGSSPWTINDYRSVATTWTNISSAGSVTASSGLVFSNSSGTSYLTSGTGTAARTPLSGLLDGWSRPLKPTDTFIPLVKMSLTAGSASTNFYLSLSGATIGSAPRAMVLNRTATTLQAAFRLTANATLDYAATGITAAGWLGMLFQGARRSISNALLSTSPSGTPGVDWWPTAYFGAERLAFDQGLCAQAWQLNLFTDLLLVQIGSTNTEKFTATDVAILRTVVFQDEL